MTFRAHAPAEMVGRGAFTIEFAGAKQHLPAMCVLSWHGGVDVKKTWWIATLSAALLAVAGTASVALEEQKAPAPVQGGAEAGAAVQSPAPAAKNSEGTEIRIPGLGKLGTLPKMDFGLELLYGATEVDKPQDPKIDENQDDLTIRGSVKHRF